MDRLQADHVMAGLKTTSDKIRALGRSGYARKEISILLDKRYQHVRKVLLDAGITGGLRRQVKAVREPVMVDAAAPPREATSCDVLLRAGFRVVGEWIQDPGRDD
jgi:hypothetical protein